MKCLFSLIANAVLFTGFGAELVAKTDTDDLAAQRMGRYNVIWISPSKDASGVMPLGNGDLGVGVYAIENGDLYLLLSKNDAFNASGHLYKTGRVRVSLTPNPFAKGKPFRQTLDLPTASIQIEADGVTIRIWADANRPVYHVEIDSPREISLTAQPEFWKRQDNTSDVRVDRGSQVLWYFAVGDKSSYRGALDTIRKKWNIELAEDILPDRYRFNTFGNLLESSELSLTHGALVGEGRKFDLRIHSLTMQTLDPGNVWVKAICNLTSKPVDLGTDWARHCAWWKTFWDRGWIAELQYVPLLHGRPEPWPLPGQVQRRALYSTTPRLRETQIHTRGRTGRWLMADARR